MFYLVLIYISVKLTFITQKYVIFLLALLGHHTHDKKSKHKYQCTYTVIGYQILHGSSILIWSLADQLHWKEHDWYKNDLSEGDFSDKKFLPLRNTWLGFNKMIPKLQLCAYSCVPTFIELCRHW